MRIRGMAAVCVLAVLVGGCSAPHATSAHPSAPGSGISARSGPAHPPPPLSAGEQRIMLGGLAVTLDTTSELAPKRDFDRRTVAVSVFNTTDNTITIGPFSAPEVFGPHGLLLSYANAGGVIEADHGPYWGSGGPPPGIPQSSDFAPGGSLRVTLVGDVPETVRRFTVRWILDPSRTASFTIDL